MIIRKSKKGSTDVTPAEISLSLRNSLTFAICVPSALSSDPGHPLNYQLPSQAGGKLPKLSFISFQSYISFSSLHCQESQAGLIHFILSCSSCMI